MVKLRLEGIPAEVDRTVESLRENFQLLQISKSYQNRNSEYVRIYIDAEILKK